jgi:hypothetical protein
MLNIHDPIRQLKYLRQTLSQNKKPLGFFLAAGCPLAVKMEDGGWPLIPDIAGLTKFVSESLKSANSPNTYDKLTIELAKAGNKNYNIEDILSFIRGLKQVAIGADNVRGLTGDELESLEKNVCKAIVEKINVALPNVNTPYHKLAQWIHLIDRNDSPIECFTTNYDLLLEQAFEETGVAYFDGFVGSRQPFFDLRAIEEGLIPKHWTRLWKIHGSINWFLNKAKEVYRSTNVNESDSYIIHPSHLKYDQSRKMPYLALIDRLSAFLKQTNAVLITSGYSFSDTHLNDAIINALKANPTAMVIVLLHGNYSSKNDDLTEIFHYPKAFGAAKQRFNLSAWAFDEAVIGGVQAKWQANLGSLNEENFGNAIVCVPEVQKTNDENEKEKTIMRFYLKLGDFEILGDFLQALIGDTQFRLEDAK